MTLNEVKEQFDLPRLEAFNKYTRKWPPQHILVAKYLMGENAGKEPISKEQAMGDFMQFFGAANGE